MADATGLDHRLCNAGRDARDSSYANLPRHLAAEGRLTLQITTTDAELRAIADGDPVRVFNDRGRCARARIRRRHGGAGVVALPAGWWASLVEGRASANTLTPGRLTDAGGGCAVHDTLVEVARVEAAAAPALGEDGFERPASEPARIVRSVSRSR